MLRKNQIPPSTASPVAQPVPVPVPAPGLRQAHEGAAAVLDADALARLAELDPTGRNELVRRVMMTFQTSAARLASQLDVARADGDRATIRLVAHTLKSSSGYLGARHLSTACAELESIAAGTDPVDLNPAIDAMKSALGAAMVAVAGHLASP